MKGPKTGQQTLKWKRNIGFDDKFGYLFPLPIANSIYDGHLSGNGWRQWNSFASGQPGYIETVSNAEIFAKLILINLFFQF